jgi:hypothetical protein
MGQTGNDIEQTLLKAGNLLAGAVGSGAVREYLLPLFFPPTPNEPTENSMPAVFLRMK